VKAFFAIFKARNTEYYRDKSALAWGFLFPLMIIIGCAVAFSKPDNSIITVGIHGNIEQLKGMELMQQAYTKTIVYDDLAKALVRIKHHQLDLLLSNENNSQYWINSESPKSQAAEQLLLSGTSDFSQQQTTGRKVRYVDWVIPGVLGMNLMFGALFGVGYVIVRYRRNGVLKRLQATPITALQFLSAQLASRLMIVVIVNGIIFIGCKLFLDLIVLGSYIDLLCIAILGGLAMISVGLLVASQTANEELAGGLLNMASWPMLFFSEVWFSLEDSPEWLQLMANFMPLTHIVKASRAVMIDGTSLVELGHHLLWLVATTLVCLTLAAKLFHWTKDE
jgi:ABC-2 type transport system permease protein